MRRSICLLLPLLFAGCGDLRSPEAAGRHRVERLNAWIADRQADSVDAAVSDEATALRPGAGQLVGDAAKRIILLDSTAVEGRGPATVRDFPGSIVETGEIERETGEPHLFTRVWTIDGSEWRLVFDAVVAPRAGPAAPERRVAETVRQAPYSTGRGPSATVGSVSVEETVAAVLRADRNVVETVRVAAEGCGGPPGTWQRRVVEEIVALDPISLGGDVLALVAPPLSIGIFRCEGPNVGEWIRSSLYAEMDDFRYGVMVAGLAEGFGYTILVGFAADGDADPQHRLLVTEALIAAAPDGRRVELGGITDRLADHYRFNGLAPVYVAKWLPVLLASPHTRATAARELIRAVAATPDQMGAAEILFTVAADVGSYDYRFADETRTIVSESLAELESRRGELPAEVVAALDAAFAARSSRRNHSGVVVRRRPLQVELTRSGESCLLSGPPPVVAAVEESAPGFRLVPRADCRPEDIRHADFDGDGSEDGLLRGVTGERGVLLAVLTGEMPSAHIVSIVGSNDWGSIQPPGTFTPACGDGTSVFPTHWISISYDEKSSSNFRFDGASFERSTGDAC